MKLKLLALAVCVVGGLVYAQVPNPCSPGQNCKAISYTSTRGTGVGFQASGDAGIGFGDGTVQNTAATAFSGSTTNYTATASANAFSYKGNMGTLWCFESGCNTRAQADGGIPTVTQSIGLLLRGMVTDSSNNSGITFGVVGNSGSAVSNANLFEVRNGATRAGYMNASGGMYISGEFAPAYVLSSLIQPNGAATMSVKSTRANGSGEVGVVLDNSGITMANDAKPVSFRNNGVEYANFWGTGQLSFTSATPIAYTSTSGVTITAAKANSSGYGWIFNNTTTLSAAGSYVVDFRNNGTSVLAVDKAGAAISGATTDTTGFAVVDGVYISLNLGTGGSYLRSSGGKIEASSAITNSGTNVAFWYNTSNALTGTTRLATWNNNSVEKAAIENDGTVTTPGLDINATTGGGSITLSSGSGTATVRSGCLPVCTNTSTEAAVKCSVSSTTLTATSGAGTDVITYLCI